MNAPIKRILLIYLMAEIFINLTEYTNRNVAEIQVVPIDRQGWLRDSLDLFPTT